MSGAAVPQCTRVRNRRKSRSDWPRIGGLVLATWSRVAVQREAGGRLFFAELTLGADVSNQRCPRNGKWTECFPSISPDTGQQGGLLSA